MTSQAPIAHTITDLGNEMLLALTTASHAARMEEVANGMMLIPDTHPMLLPSLGVVPLQLFAYYVALHRGCDIDRPRNLAKSVTVE